MNGVARLEKRSTSWIDKLEVIFCPAKRRMITYMILLATYFFIS